MSLRKPNCFQYVDVFKSKTRLTDLEKIIAQMHQIHHGNKIEFGSIEPNSTKQRNIEKIRFGSIEQIRTNSVEFDSVRFDIRGKF